MALTLFAGALTVTQAAVEPALAISDQVLILSSTVSGGSDSLEAGSVREAGYVPVLVSDTIWASLTTAQFSSYRALVLGDATCSGIAPTVIAESSARWGQAVTGNALINGTDPVYHASSGGAQLTQSSIAFAVAEPFATGLYASLSCYYDSAADGTPVTLLDGLRGPEAFKVGSASCYNNAHIVATHPALAGTTDDTLSNWSCSVHEIFTDWPADFQPLAIARDLGSTFTASDGTIGSPYILASGSAVKAFPLSLSPARQEAVQGTRATVRAELLDAVTRAPERGKKVSFRVKSGPNVGVAGSCSSDCITAADGTTSWGYSGRELGEDEIQAWLDFDGNARPDPGEPQTTAVVVRVPSATGGAFVALGDSYSSGEANAPYDAGTDTTRNRCHRSPKAYSRVLVERGDLGLIGQSVRHEACSGAVTDDFYNANPGSDRTGELAQIDEVGRDTELITLTIGGNDAGFAEVLEACIVGLKAVGRSGCGTDAALRQRVTQRIKALGRGVNATTADGRQVHAIAPLLQALQARSPDARIVVAGYPRLFGTTFSGRDCRVGNAGAFDYRISKEDIAFLNGLADNLNRVLKAAVDDARIARVNATFVSVDDRFRTHRLCDTKESWLTGLLIVAGEPSQESFHPTTEGQSQGYADALKAARIAG